MTDGPRALMFSMVMHSESAHYRRSSANSSLRWWVRQAVLALDSPAIFFDDLAEGIPPVGGGAGFSKKFDAADIGDVVLGGTT